MLKKKNIFSQFEITKRSNNHQFIVVIACELVFVLFFCTLRNLQKTLYIQKIAL